MCRSLGSADYLGSAEGRLQIFHGPKTCGSYIVGTLTSKANIIIQYYLIPYRFSTDSEIRDLEWPGIAILR